MKRFLAAFLALLVPVTMGAQTISVQQAKLFYNYDVTTAGYTYGTFSNDPTINIDPLSDKGIEVRKMVATVGSSTTITAVTASSAPFLGPQVGDLLIFTLPYTAVNLNRVAIAAGTGTGERVERRLTTHTSDDAVVVDSAIDLGLTPGVGVRWKKFITGTAAGSGWIPVGGFKSANFKASVTTLNATSLDFTVDCKGEGVNALPNQVYTKNFTSATYPANTTAVAVALEYAQYRYCRAGWKINTDTGAQSVQTDVEITR